jgi:hypothetical protein
MPEPHLPEIDRSHSGELAADSKEVLLESLQARRLGAQQGGQYLGSDPAIGMANGFDSRARSAASERVSLKKVHPGDSKSRLSIHSRPSINPNSIALSWRTKACSVRIVVRTSGESPRRISTTGVNRNWLSVS